MGWIPISNSIFDDPWIINLSMDLEISEVEVVGSLVKLWTYIDRTTENGFLPWQPDRVGAILKVHPALAPALVRHQLAESDGQSTRIIWMPMTQTALAVEREQAAKAQKRKADGRRGGTSKGAADPLPDTSKGAADPLPDTSKGAPRVSQSAVLPDLTIPDLTKPTSPPPEPSVSGEGGGGGLKKPSRTIDKNGAMVVDLQAEREHSAKVRQLKLRTLIDKHIPENSRDRVIQAMHGNADPLQTIKEAIKASKKPEIKDPQAWLVWRLCS